MRHVLCGRGIFVAAVICLLIPLRALGAESVAPDDEIYSPLIEAHEFEFEGRAYHLDGNGTGQDRDTEYRLEAGYSPTSFWHTSVEPVIVNGPHSHASTQQVQFENTFRFTPVGRYVVDVGAFFDYELNTAGGDDEVVLGPIFEKRVGPVALDANLLASRDLGGDGEYGLSYGWQLRYKTAPNYAVGIQGFGEREFDDEEPGEEAGEAEDDADFAEGGNGPTFGSGDRAGPALFGRIPLGDDGIDYQLGVQFGLDSGAADHTLRLALEYEL